MKDRFASTGKDVEGVFFMYKLKPCENKNFKSPYTANSNTRLQLLHSEKQTVKEAGLELYMVNQLLDVSAALLPVPHQKLSARLSTNTRKTSSRTMTPDRRLEDGQERRCENGGVDCRPTRQRAYCGKRMSASSTF